MTRKEIQQVLTEEFVKWATEQEVAFYVPNQVFEPVVGQPYVQLWFLEANISDTVLAEGHERINGLMQVDLNVPYGEGESWIFSLYDSFKLIFKTNKKLRNKYGSVQLSKVYLSGQQGERPWYTKYITVEYSEFSDNE